MVIYGTTELSERRQARELLAWGAAEHWGLTPLPPLERGPMGKPFFAGLEGRCFNLSHSGTLALCALSDRPVGVDIQVVKHWRPGLPRKVCSDKELAWLEAEGDPWERFCVLWTLKECLVKQEGTGLNRRLSGIRVPLPKEEGSLMEQEGLWFRTYRGPGWRGAACGLEPPPERIWWRSEKNLSVTPLQVEKTLL